MALAVTLKASGVVDENTTGSVAATEVLGAITFAANSVVFVVLGATKANSAQLYSILRASASGLTFTEETGAGQAVSNTACMRVLSAPHSAGGSTTITIDTNTQSVFGLFYAIYEATGHSAADPIGAFVASAASTPLDGAHSITLNASPVTTSIVIAAVYADADAGASTVDPGAGWTEDVDIDSTASFFGVMELERRTGSTSTSVAWADIRAGASPALFSIAAAAVEIVEAATAGPDPYQRLPRPFAGPVPRLFRTGIRVPLQLQGDRTSPAGSSDQTVSPSTIATIAALPAPTIATGSTATPGTIATVATLPAPTVQTGSNATVTPATIATASAVGSPTVQTGSTVQPATIATVASLPAVTVAAESAADPNQAGPQIAWMFMAPSQASMQLRGSTQTAVQPDATVTPATIATVAGIGSPTISTGSTVSPATIATVAALPAPTVSGAATPTPGTIATAASVPGPTVQTGSTVQPGSLATTAALPAPSLKTGSTATPGTIAIVAALPAPAVSAGGNATVSPATIATTASVPASALSTGQQVTAVTIATAAALPAPSVRTGVTTAPAAVATAVSLPAPSLSTGQRVTAVTIATTVALPAPTIAISRTVTAVTIATVAILPAPTLRTGSTVAAQAIATYASVGAAIVQIIIPAVYGTAAAGHTTGPSGRVGSSSASTGRAGQALVGSGSSGRG